MNNVLHLATENLEEVANLMRREGAFAWWYVDLVDDRGRGLVLIGSFGLPFVPGSRACPRPIDRPSLALSLYDHGRSVFYALQTFEPDDEGEPYAVFVSERCQDGDMVVGRAVSGGARADR